MNSLLIHAARLLIIIHVDQSGSMRGSRLTNTKAAAKEIIAQMKDNDRCAVIGFTYSSDVKQTLTSDKTALLISRGKIFKRINLKRCCFQNASLIIFLIILWTRIKPRGLIFPTLKGFPRRSI